MRISIASVIIVLSFWGGLSYKAPKPDKSKYTDTTDWKGWRDKHDYKPWE